MYIDAIKRSVLTIYGGFGEIIANTNFIESQIVDTAATDGKNIFYNPNFFKKISYDESVGVIAHEIYHIAFNHVERRKDRDPVLWNLATDAVANANLRRDGLVLGDATVNIPEAFNYDAETMYRKLLKEQEKELKNNNNSSNTQDSNQNSDFKRNYDIARNTHSLWDKQPNQSRSKGQENKSNTSDSNHRNETKKDASSPTPQKNNPSSNSADKGTQNNGMSNKQQSSTNCQEETKKDASSLTPQKNNASSNSTDKSTQNNGMSNNQQSSTNCQKETKKDASSPNPQKNNPSSNSTNKSTQNNGMSNKQQLNSNPFQTSRNGEKLSTSQNKKNNSASNLDNNIKDIDNQIKDGNNGDSDFSKSNNRLLDEIKKICETNEKDFFEQNRINRKKRLEKMRDLISKNISTNNYRTNSQKIDINNIGKTKPLIDWRRLLKDATNFKYDWTYQNAEIEDGVLVPTLEKIPISKTEIVLDTSGSIDEEILRSFLRECKHIIQNSHVKVGCFDTKFYGFVEIRNESDIDNLNFYGGGGTNFDVAVNAFSRKVENKIIFTDGLAQMPSKAVDVIWIVFGWKKISPKRGKVIYINLEDLTQTKRKIKKF